jgi:hypothetical protein
MTTTNNGNSKPDMHATDYLKVKARNDNAVANLDTDKVRNDAKVQRRYDSLDK